MATQTISTQPIEGQKPGTSGLRKKTKVFMTPHFLENFIQSTFNAIGGVKGKSLVVGGDGRFFGQEAAQVILKMASANGAVKVIIGQQALLSTPAASNLIRKYKTDGGIIMSASHNPGGIDEDFGVKFNSDNGGPAAESITDKIFAETTSLSEYLISDSADVNLNTLGTTKLDDMIIEVIDPVADYAILMEELFDFPLIKKMFAGGFKMRFDAMNAITGPYAKVILENKLGAAKGTVVHGVPLPDFGGMHPDPNPTWAHELWDEMMGDNAPDFGAASDGDGDRNMIVGKHAYVGPSDSLAILAEHATKVKAYAKGLAGVARSMPTGAAVDRVAKDLGIACFETPTGWKFFGNLLDAERVTLCGEESFGTGSDHVREKDGLWTVLCWLNILAVTGQSVQQLMTAHWQKFGRTYFSRHDYEAIPSDDANASMNDLRDRLSSLAGQKAEEGVIASADEFSYTDPVDGSVSNNQGFRIIFESGSRIIARLSGTGTQGATLRLYLERYVPNSGELLLETQTALEPIIHSANALLKLDQLKSHTKPDVIT